MASDNPPEQPKKPGKYEVDVNHSQGTVIGDNARVTQNFFTDPRMRPYLIALGVLVIAAAVALYFLLSSSTRRSIQAAIPTAPTPTPKYMSGNLNIAVSAFVVSGQASDPLLGRKLADNLYRNLDQQIQELKNAGAINVPQVWGPDMFETVTGATPEERASAAAQIAARYNIHLLIYASVDASQPVLQVAPEFYISEKSFYDAREITGQYQLGAPFRVPGDPLSPPFITALNNNLAPRIQTLALMVQGLSYFTARDYDRALKVYEQSLPNLDRLSSPERAVIYLLAGNAAQWDKKYADAGKYYDLSLKEDPQYARPMIGKASVLYLLALDPYSRSQDPKDIDKALLEQSIEQYKAAAQAAHQPPLSDVPVKVHLGLGQCYYFQAYTGQASSFSAAIVEFQAVIAAYDSGSADVQARIRDMTGLAHGHLGLIYKQAGKKQDAIREYQQAADLFKNSFDQARQQYYEERLAELQSQTP